jgi:excisionase family DNA binding protein
MLTEARQKEPATFLTRVEDVRGLGTVPAWSASEPNAAGLLRIGRTLAYRQVESGDLPSIRVGRALRVPVAPLLALLGIED